MNNPNSLSDEDKFLVWKGRVNLAIIDLTEGFLSLEDLPDWRYRDAYEEGMTPSRAAKAAIKYASEC